MHKTLAAATTLATLAFCGAARAEDADNNPAGDKAPILERAFGSTIVSTYPDGRQAQLWLRKDGSYVAEGRRLDRSSGVWQVKGDKLCMKQRAPFPAPFSYCTPIPPAGIQRSWSGRAFTGEEIMIKLVKGMRGRDPKASSAEAGKGKDQG